jgi:putative transcriptional regulator
VSKLFDEMMAGLDDVERYMKGDSTGMKVHVPVEIDVAKIRKGLKMTQANFCRTFGFSLDTVKHWEGGRRRPESAARAFLTVIARNPKAVIEALHTKA